MDKLLLMIIEKITEEIYWVIIGILALNMFQRKHHPRSAKKRSATLIIASLILLFNVLLVLIIQFKLSEWLGILAAIVPIVVGYAVRKRLLLFRVTCPSCGVKSTLNTVFYYDDNLCDACYKKEHPELVKETAAEEKTEPAVIVEPSAARDVRDIDWDTWEPQETAVVCYVFDEDRVLLIDKKRGLGSGLVNAPGGRIEEAETASEAAVRETEEETGITPSELSLMGTLSFQFVDGYSLRGYIFFAKAWSGKLQETDEANPFWVPVSEIPYENMWEDDSHWLPLALAGKKVQGRFIFDDRKMLSMSLEESE